MSNRWRNWSVENGHYFKDGIPELAIPNEHLFHYLNQAWFPGIGHADGEPYLTGRPESVNWKQPLPGFEQYLFLDGVFNWKIFTTNRTHYCAIEQKISGLTPGVECTMLIPLYADVFTWEGHKEPPGDAWTAETRLGWNEGHAQPWPAAVASAAGETDPSVWDVGVNWSSWFNVPSGTLHYLGDEYNLLELRFTPTTSEIQVWAEIKCKWPMDNCGWFGDAFRLMQAGEPVDPSGPPDPPVDPPECEDPPRVDFLRLYAVLPEYAGKGLASHVMEVLHEPNKRTVGSSNDDAGMGPLSTKYAVVLDPDSYANDIEAFYEQYYPGAQYWPLRYTNEYQLDGRLRGYDVKAMGLELVNPSTYDPPVVTEEFGVPRTYGHHNGLDLRGSWQAYSSKIVACYAGEVVRAGYYADEKWYGYQVRTRSILPDGREMLVRYAHMEPDGVLVDVGSQVVAGQEIGLPDNTGDSIGAHVHYDIKIGGEYVDPELVTDLGVVVDPPDPPDPPDPEPPEKLTRGYVGLHTQVPNSPDFAYIGKFMREVEPPSIKTFHLGENVLDYVRWSPNTLVTYRQHITNQRPYWDTDDPDAQAARYVDHFRDAMVWACRGVDAIAPSKGIAAYSINEEFGSDHAKNDLIKAFDIAFCKEIMQLAAEENINVWPVVMTAAVGNPIESYYPNLLELADWAIQADGFLGPNCYWWGNPNECALKGVWRTGDSGQQYFQNWWSYHAGRLTMMDDVFTAAGRYVKWLVGEVGVVGSENGYHLSPTSGWRDGNCFQGDWPRYRTCIMDWDRLWGIWDAEHQGRFYGGSFFTVNDESQGWSKFRLEAPQVMDLIAPLRARYP